MLVDVVKVMVALPLVHKLEFFAFVFFLVYPAQGFDTITK
jgi:hypothetical protein